MPAAVTPDVLDQDRRPGATPALVLAGAVALLALPSAVLAFSSRVDVPPASDQASGAPGHFAPGGVDARAASALLGGSGLAGSGLAGSGLAGSGLAGSGLAGSANPSSLFRFTPAGLSARPDRSVTVAIRVDAETARAIIVRAAPAAPARMAIATAAPLHIAAAGYSLGAGHTSPLAPPGFVLAAENRRPDMLDIRNYPAGESAAGAGARLAPQISLAARERPGAAPRTLQSGGEQVVDLGGSYRLTRNIDVTAGVRYSQDRDRLKPLADGKSDTQAVFVGTQFKF